MDRRKLVDKRSGFFNAKRTSALDGLLGKLDKQIAREGDLKFGNQKPKPNLAGAVLGLGVGSIGASLSRPNPFPNPFNPINPMSPTSTLRPKRRSPVRNGDPLNMKKRMQKAREARRNAVLARHRGGTNTNQEEDVEVERDLKENEEFVDENKYKTMEWTEPDGSVTTLKFDQDGTLVGKETTKSSRPDKFSKDLKKAVDRNSVALKDYEESLMTDPVQ